MKNHCEGDRGQEMTEEEKQRLHRIVNHRAQLLTALREIETILSYGIKENREKSIRYIINEARKGTKLS